MGELFHIDIEGLDETIAALESVSDGLNGEIEAEITAQGTPIYYAAQVYPPPRAGSKYVRTYDYQRSIWQDVQVYGNDIYYEAGSSSPVDVYLRGDLHTGYPGAWMHVGRWRTWRDIIDTFKPVMEFKLIERVRNFLTSKLGH